MKSLTIFDLDDTLIGGDSASLWLHYLVQQGWVPPDMLVTEQHMMQVYQRGELSMADYMACTLQPLRGITVSEVAHRAAAFIASTIPDLVFPAAREQIDWHRSTAITCRSSPPPSTSSCVRLPPCLV